MTIKELTCKIFGHKPKAEMPLRYFINGKEVVSRNIPVFCDRCKEGELQMVLDGTSVEKLTKIKNNLIKLLYANTTKN